MLAPSSAGRREPEPHCWYMRVHCVLGYATLLGVQEYGVLCWGVTDSPTFPFLSPFTASPTLTSSAPESKATGAAGPAQAGLSPRNTSSPIKGLQNNRCLISCPFLSSEVGGGVQPPGSGGRALASLKVPARQGRGPRGDEGF